MKLEEIAVPLLNWYAQNARALPWREAVTPYRVWVSEVMLQQTRVQVVKDYFLRFMDELPDIQALAQVPEMRLLKLWEGLGYYNRARHLQKAAKIVLQRHAGILPGSYEELRALPGFGAYTAGAVASIAFGAPVPAVDGNVLRVISRLTASRANISDPAVRRAVTEQLYAIMPKERPGDFNQALMELGATVCAPRGVPSCGACPLERLCEGRAQGIAAQLPVKSAPKSRRIEKRTILLLVRDRHIAIRKRPNRGLLGGLWELPSLEGHVAQTRAVQAVREWGLSPLRAELLEPSRHIFSHIEWQMIGLRLTVEECIPASGLIWMVPEMLQKEYPLPSAFHSYLAGIYR